MGERAEGWSEVSWLARMGGSEVGVRGGWGIEYRGRVGSLVGTGCWGVKVRDGVAESPEKDGVVGEGGGEGRRKRNNWPSAIYIYI